MVRKIFGQPWIAILPGKWLADNTDCVVWALPKYFTVSTLFQAPQHKVVRDIPSIFTQLNMSNHHSILYSVQATSRAMP